MIIPKIEAIVSLVPNAQVSVLGDGTVIWYDPPVAPVTNEQIDAEWARLEAQIPFDNCKKQASELLYETDWTQIPDCPLVNKQEFFDYRAILRNYALNPVADPVFPPKPTCVW